MEYINLIDKISKEDKIKLNNYISLYGIQKEHFIGLDKWLQNWSHSNQRLYKLLGNNLTIEEEIEYEKDEDCVKNEIALLISNHDFIKEYHHFLWSVLKEYFNNIYTNEESFRLCNQFDNILNKFVLFDNSCHFTIKFKRPEASKMLQIQAGSKPIKALNRIMEYFKDIYTFDTKTFENFKTQYSLIISEKKAKGTFVISIHPMDYITMSDNDSNWSSCMSWIEDGCYHLGTVEMMNSNNVLCCFLKHKNKDFLFNKKLQEGEDPANYSWNDKKWRNLVYITKDIIMGGKAYPFFNDDLTKILIKKVKELAYKNLDWKYSFGPELYKDMIHINSLGKMEQNHSWLRTKYTTKHNIIWDTKGMYNDMLNASYVKYWCYRNKVKSNKIICVSGKAPCLCCGEDVVLEPGDYYEDYYNERFDNTGTLVCTDCVNEYSTCYCCGGTHTINKSIFVRELNKEITICEECYKNYFRICPDCGQIFFINKDDYKHNSIKDQIFTIMDDDTKRPLFFDSLSWEILTTEKDNYWENKKEAKETYLRCICCPDCKENLLKKTFIITIKQNLGWFFDNEKEYKIHYLPYKEAQRYIIKNLEKPYNKD